MKRLFKVLAVLIALLMLAFVVFRTPDTEPDEMRAKYAGEPSQFVEIGDGVTVHLRDEGPRDAPAIILLHGSTADLHTWGPWADGLKETYRVIRFDQIGHGLTGPDSNEDYSRESFVADIGEVADALGLDRFVIAGSSMGGSHAMAYALAHPERLEGIVLVGASGAPIRRDGGGRSFAMTLAQTPVVNRLMAHITPRSMVEQSFTKMVSNKDMVTPAMVDRYWEMLRYPGNRSATITRFAAERVSFDADEVSGVEVPTLVIWGAEDPLIPVASGRWYDEHLPNSTLVEYEEIGHLPHEEAAQTSLSDFKSWLLNLPSIRPDL